jgi:hypothetical protein
MGRYFELAASIPAYAPMGVKFWRTKETALEGLKEFADGYLPDVIAMGGA